MKCVEVTSIGHKICFDNFNILNKEKNEQKAIQILQHFIRTSIGMRGHCCVRCAKVWILCKFEIVWYLVVLRNREFLIFFLYTNEKSRKSLILIILCHFFSQNFHLKIFVILLIMHLHYNCISAVNFTLWESQGFLKDYSNFNPCEVQWNSLGLSEKCFHKNTAGFC